MHKKVNAHAASFRTLDRAEWKTERRARRGVDGIRPARDSRGDRARAGEPTPARRRISTVASLSPRRRRPSRFVRSEIERAGRPASVFCMELNAACEQAREASDRSCRSLVVEPIGRSPGQRTRLVLAGKQRGLRSVVYTELAHDLANMNFDRCFGHIEISGNSLVRHAVS